MITDYLEIPWIIAACLAGLGLALSGIGNILTFFRKHQGMSNTEVEATRKRLIAVRNIIETMRGDRP